VRELKNLFHGTGRINLNKSLANIICRRDCLSKTIYRKKVLIKKVSNNIISSKDNRNRSESSTDRSSPELTVVIPVFNEEDSMMFLYENLSSVLDNMKVPYEVILVDDGSTDSTFEKLKDMHERNSSFKVIRFRRNFGQTQAMRAGFANATGKTIVTLDADLQNDPADIPRILEKMDEGYDIVSGWRKDRKDNTISRKIPSLIANKLISKLFNVRIHDYGCTLKAYKKDVLDNVELYGEMHRYIPAIASWMGVKVGEIVVNHRSRKFGKAKYGLSRTIRVLLDIITIKFLLTYSKKPMQIFGLIGFFSTLLGSVLTLWLLVQRVFFKIALSTRPVFILSVFIMIVGIQFITMGLLGEIMMRTYHEGTGKPTYLIRETLD
jgi:glycosyltransferase involved in cell wall biosynthesis